MGVANSKRKYSGGPNYSANRGKADEDKPEEEEEEDDDIFKEGEAQPQKLTIDQIKKKNLKMWSPVFKEFFGLKQVKFKVKTTAKNEPSDKFVEKKIAYTEDDVQQYVNGKENDPLTEYFINDLDKTYLLNDEMKGLLETMAKGSEGQDIRKLMPGLDTKPNEAALTGLIPGFLSLTLPLVKKAVQHKALTEVIKYVVTTDKFKKEHSTSNIDVHKENIIKGTHSKEEAALANKNKNKKGDEPPPEQTGGDALQPEQTGGDALQPEQTGGDALQPEQTGGDALQPEQTGGDALQPEQTGGVDNEDDEDETSDDEDESSVEEDETSVEEEGDQEEDDTSDDDDPMTGGKTAEEKEFKKFKKGEKANMEEKTKAFLFDTVETTKFIDANEDVLLSIFSKSTIGKNVDKKSPGIDTVVPILFKTIDSYEKKDDTEGEAGKEAAAGAAPAAKTDGEGAAKAEGEGAGEADGEGAAKTDDKAAAKPEAGEVKKPPIVPLGGGEIEPQTGGGQHKKKKRYSRKKPRHINISINVGNKNAIASESSSESDSSSSSDSSSESDSSSSSDSSSDNERKHKYVVNKQYKKKY